MSQNLYGQVEVYDREKRVWQNAPLYKKSDDGGFISSDLFHGGRNAVRAVFGEDFFDINEPSDELNIAVDSILCNARQITIKDLAKETYYRIAGPVLGVNTPLAIPEENARIACYTGFDIMLLEVLSKQISKSAKEFFDEYFGHIKAVIQVVSAAYGIYDDRHIRVIVYGL